MSLVGSFLWKFCSQPSQHCDRGDMLHQNSVCMFQLHGTPQDSTFYDPLFMQADQIKFSIFNLTVFCICQTMKLSDPLNYVKASNAGIELDIFKTYHDQNWFRQLSNVLPLFGLNLGNLGSSKSCNLHGNMRDNTFKAAKRDYN